MPKVVLNSGSSALLVQGAILSCPRDLGPCLIERTEPVPSTVRIPLAQTSAALPASAYSPGLPQGHCSTPPSTPHLPPPHPCASPRRSSVPRRTRMPPPSPTNPPATAATACEPCLQTHPPGPDLPATAPYSPKACPADAVPPRSAFPPSG